MKPLERVKTSEPNIAWQRRHGPKSNSPLLNTFARCWRGSCGWSLRAESAANLHCHGKCDASQAAAAAAASTDASSPPGARS